MSDLQAFPISRSDQRRRVLKAKGIAMTNNDASRAAGCPKEEARLLELLNGAATADEAGEQLGRTRQAIYARLQRFQKQNGRTNRTTGKSFPQMSK
ncbi:MULTISPECIES: hypothetical protein [Bradyrhizobium]|uniref:hypothetical protein n=1 Tax=Bradyrhizobium TaxID=374 RepID=UPI001EDB1883|nr:hypothetical protein [Bradyrhizobium zhengyangense]MCG2645585.1 hypothetical protein [Bradyrhizobium zhengyangense]